MDNATHIQNLRQLAEDRGDSFRSDYSGRGMNGKTCVGITTDQPIEVIEEASEIGVRGACQDSMGRRHIVYWPKLSVET